MKKLMVIAVSVGLCLGFAGMAMAGSTADQTVNYEVQAINEISVSGPATLTINSATAGQEPDNATDTSTTYSITTNGTGKKITAALGTAMPDNTILKVTLASTGATSAGAVTLSTTDADVVTGVETLAEDGSQITYVLSATVDAGIVASAAKTVTYTIADAS